jgi:hypothetical protein
MLEKKLTLAAVASVAAALAVAALVPVAVAAAPLQIIAAQVRVESQNGSSNGTYRIGDGIPVQIGEQVKVSLVGTAIVNGIGVESPVNARFTVAAGGHNIELVRTGPNWAIVKVNDNGGNGLAQLAYSVVGDYQMRNDHDGRFTFKIGGNPPAADNPGDGARMGRGDRWDKARSLTSMLYLAILGEPPRGRQAEIDTQRIYRNGFGGVLDVAASLTRQAEDRGLGRATVERGYQDRDIERVAGLYRDLLHRQDDNRTMWDRDRGFRDNVEALHRRGLSVVVQSIVSSDEFRTANNLGDFSPLPAR